MKTSRLRRPQRSSSTFINRLFSGLGSLLVICLATGCALSTAVAQKWPTGSLAFPVGEWKTIDKSGKFISMPFKEIPKWEGWTESADDSHRKTRIRVEKDGAKLTYTFGTEWGPKCDDRLIIKRENGGKHRNCVRFAICIRTSLRWLKCFCCYVL
jgi:hypothetical protein